MGIRKTAWNIFIVLVLLGAFLGYAAGFFMILFLLFPYWKAGLYLVIGVGCVLSLPVLLALLKLFSVRWRPLKVFISYKHHFKEEVELLKGALERQGVVVRYLKFEPRYHDNTIQEVQQSLRWMDAMVVIPDAERSSFVDSEIMGASLLKKPLVLMRHSPQQRLPDTAFSGYPVVDLEKIRQQDFRPLVDYFLFVRNHRRDYFPGMGRLLEYLFTRFRDLIERVRLDWEWLFFVLGYFLIKGFIKAEWVNILGLALGGGLLLAGIIFVFVSLFQKHQALQAARQTLLTGEATYFYLSDALGSRERDKAILNAIERESLAVPKAQKPRKKKQTSETDSGAGST